jgi:succinate dehydrogenase / fumarate reductase iron-sulfur subunit
MKHYTKMIRFSIYRFDPDKDSKPYMQEYQLDESKLEGRQMLLDAILLLKEQDESLSFRRSCREGVCGSDAMNINGRNGLACITPWSSLKQPIKLNPLPGMPVIRDLIVDMEPFYRQYRTIKPWLMNDEPEPEIERLQSNEDRKKLDGLYECILCGCCSTQGDQ